MAEAQRVTFILNFFDLVCSKACYLFIKNTDMAFKFVAFTANKITEASTDLLKKQKLSPMFYLPPKLPNF